MEAVRKMRSYFTLNGKSHLSVFVLMLALTVFLSLANTGTAVALDGPRQIWPDQRVYQQTDNIVVGADQRLFTTMCIFNSLYNYGQDSKAESNPLRQKVNAELQKRLKSVPAKQITAWKNYYKKHQWHIYYYVDYTMSLSQYPFHQVLHKPTSGNWFTRLFKHPQETRGFEKVMNEFWVALNLDSLWKSVLPDYMAEVKKFDLKRIAKEEGYVWTYLHTSKVNAGRTLLSIPNLMDVNYSAFASEYPGYYFAISSPGSHNYGLNIHEYLHGIVSPIVEKNYSKYASTLKTYFIAGQKSPVIKGNYNSLEGFVEENVVRAMDLRIRYTNQMITRNQVIDDINQQMGQGFTLLRVFYDLLQEFEEERDSTLEQYFPNIMEIVPPYQSK